MTLEITEPLGVQCSIPLRGVHYKVILIIGMKTKIATKFLNINNNLFHKKITLPRKAKLRLMFLKDPNIYKLGGLS